MLVTCLLSSVCLRFSWFSQLSSIQYMGLCVFSLLISLMMIVRICALYFIIIKLEVWSIWHCLGLGHETGRRCMPVYIRISLLDCLIGCNTWIQWRRCKVTTLLLGWDDTNMALTICIIFIEKLNALRIWEYIILTWLWFIFKMQILNLKDWQLLLNGRQYSVSAALRSYNYYYHYLKCDRKF